MIRKIIKIDETKCNGCGLCAKACHEGAIDIIDGKAKLMREHFCDGLGDCLPNCPTGAITFEEREAPAYDEAAVLAAQKAKGQAHTGCPGTISRQIQRPASEVSAVSMPSMLTNWPVQIKLAPIRAPYFDGCDLLVAASCSAYAYANLHNDFIKDRVTLIGCPKLDGVDYANKLMQIFHMNAVNSITVVRMEVPCCGGLENAVKRAVAACGRDIPVKVVTVGIDGQLR